VEVLRRFQEVLHRYRVRNRAIVGDSQKGNSVRSKKEGSRGEKREIFETRGGKASSLAVRSAEEVR